MQSTTEQARARQRVVSLLARLKMSRTKFATHAGVNPATIKRYLEGITFSDETARKIAAAAERLGGGQFAQGSMPMSVKVPPHKSHGFQVDMEANVAVITLQNSEGAEYSFTADEVQIDAIVRFLQTVRANIDKDKNVSTG